MPHSFRTRIVFGAAAVMLAASAPLQADIIATHTGSNDPATEGWQPYRNISGAEWNHTASPDVGPVNDNGIAAWRVRDTPTPAVGGASHGSEELPYRLSGDDLGTGNQVRTSHWRLSAFVKAFPRVEHVNDPDASWKNAAMEVRGYTRTESGIRFGFRYQLNMADNGDGGTDLRIEGNTPTVTLTIPTGYNWIEMIYDPDDHAADLYINGELAHEGLPKQGVFGGSANNRARFGDFVLVNGGFGGANWGFVEFEMDEQPVSAIGTPEPTSLSLLALGGVPLLRRRRR